LRLGGQGPLAARRSPCGDRLRGPRGARQRRDVRRVPSRQGGRRCPVSLRLMEENREGRRKGDQKGAVKKSLGFPDHDEGRAPPSSSLLLSDLLPSSPPCFFSHPNGPSY